LDVRRLTDHLAAKIRESGYTQAAVSLSLGWGPDYVNQLLRANLDLRLAHVYAILEAIEVSPGRFFGELHADSASRQRAFVERLLPELLAKAQAALEPGTDGAGVRPRRQAAARARSRAGRRGAGEDGAPGGEDPR
jgi:hypothetical protein